MGREAIPTARAKENSGHLIEPDSILATLIEEEPAFFATADGKEYLESVKTRHLPSLELEINHLRDLLPAEE